MAKSNDISRQKSSLLVPVTMEEVENKIFIVREKQVILDSDVAKLYGVETRAINQAVKNNPAKFPEGYLFKLDNQEFANLKSKILTSSFEEWGGTRKQPTVFTERGIYMLATILKGERAVQTTITIIDTFSQLREVARTMKAIALENDEQEKKTLMKRGGELIGEVIGSQLDTTATETEIELNFAVIKIKHKITRNKN